MFNKNHSSLGIHPSIILEIIEKQNSSIWAFIKELVQNGRDADATKIYMYLTENYFIYLDNGSGMDRQTILDYLVVLGASNKRGDPTKTGKKGIGSSQAYPFGINTYFTQNNFYQFDFKKVKENFEQNDYQLRYELGENPMGYTPGTMIIIEFYDAQKIASYKLSNVIDQIKNQFRFSTLDVYINDELCEKPDYSNKDAIHYKSAIGDFHAIKTDGSPKLYCEELYVMNLYNAIFDKYDIYSPQLELTSARDKPILTHENYKYFQEFIDQVNVKILGERDNRVRFDNSDNLIALFRKGLINKSEIFKLKFIPTYEKTNLSLQTLRKSGNYCINVGTMEAHMRGFASEFIKNLGLTTVYMDHKLASFVRELGVTVINFEASDYHQKVTEEYEASKNMRIVSIQQMANDSTKPKSKVKYMKMVRILNHFVARELEVEKRKIRFCDRATYMAATDGKTYINFNIHYIDYFTKYTEVYKILHTLIHEYSHIQDAEECNHGVDFYQRFHNYMQKVALIFEVVMPKTMKFLSQKYEEHWKD